MSIRNFLHRGLLVCALLLLDACGGGGGTLAEGGIGGTGISSGPITGFGSIFVNGIEYDTQGAEIIVEGVSAGTGDAAALNNLAVGHVVTVEGSIPDGTQATATRVYFSDNVEGPIQAVTVVDAGTRELTVLGQTVIVTTDTAIENATLGTLAVNNVVEVSGLVRSDGTIQATFIEKKSDSFNDGVSVEVKGVVANLDTLARTFTISAATVSYAGADLTGLDAPLADGSTVEVKGIYSGGTLLASRIETEDDLNVTSTTTWLEIEGYITSMTSSSEFVVNSQRVLTSASTRFEGGTAADLIAGARVEVEGSYSGGILTATVVQFLDDVSLQAKVDSVAADSLTLMGIAGLTVSANALTEVDGAVDSFAAITGGRFVKVVGSWSSTTNRVIASKIEVENPSSTIEIKLRGVLTNASEPFISLLGTTLDTTGAGYRSASGSTLSAAQFFAQVAAGTPVSVEGRQDNATNALTWMRARIQASP